MKLEFYIARRYLFARKSKNIINYISMISMVVVAFVTAAMICVMAAFNGIDSLVKDLFGKFDAPLTILPAEGKFFDAALVNDSALYKIDGVNVVCPVIEEDAWINYADNNAVATIKGVPDNYPLLAPFDSLMYIGRFDLRADSMPRAIPGLGVRSELLMAFDEDDPPMLHINAPVRGKKLSRHREEAFNREHITVSGVFSANAELDMKYVFVPLSFAKQLFSMDSLISSIEIGVREDADPEVVRKEMLKRLPSSLVIQSRLEKNALIYKTNKSEKWATFLVLLFILVIACFNIIASLTMLIIEKRKDISVLSSLGATRRTIERIFMLEGIFINLIGACTGLMAGLILCWLQQRYGLVSMSGAVVDYYPVQIRIPDVIGTFTSVLAVGTLFCVGLVHMLMKRFAWEIKT